MARRGAGREKHRDEQDSLTEPYFTDKSPAKRLKINGGWSGRATPFVSWITGKDFIYDADTHDPYTFLKVTSLSKTVVPPNAFAYLRSKLECFSSDIYDILFSPECVVLCITIDPNNIIAYERFIKPGKHRVPKTDCYIQVIHEQIDDILIREYNYSFEDNPENIGVSENSTSSESSDSEEDIVPKSQDKSTSSDIQKNSQTSASTPVDIEMPALEDIQVSEGQISTSATITIPCPEAPLLDQRELARRRTRARFTKIDFKKLEVIVPPQPEVLTILFRPINPDDSLHKQNPYKINAALMLHGGTVLFTRNIRNGGIAVDFAQETPAEPLLMVEEICGVSVTSSKPVIRNSCVAVISGVHWEITEDQIKQDLKTSPETTLTSVQRLAKPGQKSWVVKVEFQGTKLPEKAFLEGRSHRIRPYESRPLLVS